MLSPAPLQPPRRTSAVSTSAVPSKATATKNRHLGPFARHLPPRAALDGLRPRPTVLSSKLLLCCSLCRERSTCGMIEEQNLVTLIAIAIQKTPPNRSVGLCSPSPPLLHSDMPLQPSAWGRLIVLPPPSRSSASAPPPSPPAVQRVHRSLRPSRGRFHSPFTAACPRQHTTTAVSTGR